jgi:hypothetical protein
MLPIVACSASPAPAKPRRLGPKINIGHFTKSTATYKGKTITLGLKLDELSANEQGKSLRDFVGRDAKFTTTASTGEHLRLVISIPEGISLPEAADSDDLVVTFLCQHGDLRHGNVAKSIQTSNGPWEDVD